MELLFNPLDDLRIAVDTRVQNITAEEIERNPNITDDQLNDLIWADTMAHLGATQVFNGYFTAQGPGGEWKTGHTLYMSLVGKHI